jgi:cytochrome c peroxidase
VPSELTGRLAEALAIHLRSLRSARRSPYDRFVEHNDLPVAPAAAESSADYGARVLAELDRLEAEDRVTLPAGFDREALAGLRLFLRTRAERAAGGCVSCHPPPAFTDHAFHNVGASQDEYDALHGAGAFADLVLPPLETRPVERLRRAPRRAHPEEADLGHWNHAAASSPLDLERRVAAFKTPTLRNLAYSNPYLHNGRFSTLEETLAAKLRWAAMARRGELRAPAPELASIRLDDQHLRPLVAFLAALGEELVPGRSVPALPRPVREGDRRDNYPRF